MVLSGVKGALQTTGEDGAVGALGDYALSFHASPYYRRNIRKVTGAGGGDRENPKYSCKGKE